MDTIQEVKIVLYWGLTILLMVSSMFTAVFQNARPWTPPISSKERWKRSIMVGLSTMVFCVAGLTAMGLYASPGELPPIKSILGLGCVSVPLGILIIFGSYVGFGVNDRIRDAHQRLVDKSRNNDFDG